jgi:CHAD domain-containing protein
LRELLPVLQLEGKVVGELGHRLRKVIQRLGRIRELDVTLMLVEELKTAGEYDGDALERVGSAIRGERERARHELMAKWPAREIRRVESKLADLADRLESSDNHSQSVTRGLRWAVDARIHRRGSELKAAIEDAGAVYLPERLHAVRIALKKFRYAVELASELASDRRLRADLRLLKRNQDLLGRWHDRQVLIERARQVQASLTPPSASGVRRLDRLVTMLENDCRRLHARYIRESGAILAVCDRVGLRMHGAARRAS